MFQILFFSGSVLIHYASLNRISSLYAKYKYGREKTGGGEGITRVIPKNELLPQTHGTECFINNTVFMWSWVSWEEEKDNLEDFILSVLINLHDVHYS